MVSPLSLLANGAYASAAQTQPAKATRDQTQASPAETAARDIRDVVSISEEAREAAKIARREAGVAYYAQFMPPRAGFSVTNLALGVMDPGAEPFSRERPFAEVAHAARDSLDRNYNIMADSGTPYGSGAAEGSSWGGGDTTALFGELDRRALYAVASNEGGLFSDEEQMRARDLMRQQQGLAMGLYNGPIDREHLFQGGGLRDHAAIYKAGVAFMDGASLEEKLSDGEWAQQRAGMQFAYEQKMLDKGEPPEDLTIDHPLVRMLIEMLRAGEQEEVNRWYEDTVLHPPADE